MAKYQIFMSNGDVLELSAIWPISTCNEFIKKGEYFHELSGNIININQIAYIKKIS